MRNKAQERNRSMNENTNTQQAGTQLRKEKYIQVTYWDIVRFLITLVCVGLSVYNIWWIISTLKFYGIMNLRAENGTIFAQLPIMHQLVTEYILISLTCICIAAQLKKGFRNLKPLGKRGIWTYFSLGSCIMLLIGFMFSGATLDKGSFILVLFYSTLALIFPLGVGFFSEFETSKQEQEISN